MLFSQLHAPLSSFVIHKEFTNEPITNVSNPQTAYAMRRELARIEKSLGLEYYIVIGGKRVRTADKIKSVNPARPVRLSESTRRLKSSMRNWLSRLRLRRSLRGNMCQYKTVRRCCCELHRQYVSAKSSFVRG